MNIFLRILIASFGLAFVVGLMWGIVGFIATMTVGSDVSRIETVGLTGLVMIFIAAGIALVNGIILGAISPAPAFWRRLLWHVGVYLVLAIAWSFYGANEKRRVKELVSARDYTAFEKRIDDHLREAWAAALIHADPVAMKLCIQHGADAKTWATTDTSIAASQPNEPPIEVIVKHRYWSSLVADQQRMAQESLRLLQEAGADLNAACINSGTMTPMQYAKASNLPVLTEALQQLGTRP